jgi:malate/lactate dehydrogenase
MKIGIVGAGRVGSACALAAVVRGSAREILLVDRTRKRAEAVATDLRYGAPLGPKTTVVDGDYENLANSELVIITAGINEKTGGAIDGSDPKGRLRLFDTNAEIYRDIVPRINKNFGVTLSLPSVVGRGGVIRSFEPEMSGEERQALEAGAANLRKSENRT